jgi:hypothetical protein
VGDTWVGLTKAANCGIPGLHLGAESKNFWTSSSARRARSTGRAGHYADRFIDATRSLHDVDVDVGGVAVGFADEGAVVGRAGRALVVANR